MEGRGERVCRGAWRRGGVQAAQSWNVAERIWLGRDRNHETIVLHNTS